MAAAGIRDILIANQIVGATKIAAADRSCSIGPIRSSRSTASPTSTSSARRRAAGGKTLRVVIEVDIGMQSRGRRAGRGPWWRWPRRSRRGRACASSA